MKKIKIFAALLMGLAMAACSGQPSGDPLPKEFQPSKAQVDSVSYLLGINFGSFLKGYDFGTDLNYGEIIKGMKDFVAAKGDVRDADFAKQFKVDPNSMNDLFNSYLEKRRSGVSMMNKQKGEKFLEANGKKEGIVTTDSGLQYKILEPGNDVKPGPQDTVWVRYKGTLLDGTVFDEVAADAEPIRLTLNRVVPGWTEGLQLIGEGGKIDLYLPSELGYGEQGNQAIGPNSVLTFNVELTKVGKYVEPAPVQEQPKGKKK
jgi:FKBP-type peptidyl-prolyl cis-trans isomerase